MHQTVQLFAIVLMTTLVIQANSLSLQHIDFPTNTLANPDSSIDLNQLITLLRNISPDSPMVPDRATNTSNSITPAAAATTSPIVSGLLSAIGSALAPALGPLAPLGAIIGPLIGNLFNGFFSRGFDGIGGIVQRDDLASRDGLETFHISIPNQGVFTIMTLRPDAAAQSPAPAAILMSGATATNYNVDNMFNMAKLQQLKQDDPENLKTALPLFPLANIVLKILKFLLF